jgi:chromosome segregation ATPase
VKQDFEVERKQRADMASRHSDELGKWSVQTQKLKEQLQYAQSKLQEETQRTTADERKYQEDVNALQGELKHVTHEFEQRELQLTVKLEKQITQAVKLQKEVDEQLDRLREERDVMKMEWNSVTERYGVVKVKKEALQSEHEHLQAHVRDMDAHLHNMEEQFQMLQVDKQILEDRVRQLEDEKLKNEKIHELTASMKRDLENQLREVTEEKDQLKSKLGAMEQQKKHDYSAWMTDKQSLERTIADTSRLSDEVITLEQQLKHVKSQADSSKAKLQARIQEHKEEVRVEALITCLSLLYYSWK